MFEGDDAESTPVQGRFEVHLSLNQMLACQAIYFVICCRKAASHEKLTNKAG